MHVNTLLKKDKLTFKLFKKGLMTTRSKQNQDFGALTCLYIIGKML